MVQCTGSKSCESCGKVCVTDRSLKDHIRNVHSGNILSCNECDKAFKTKSGLRT